MNTNDQASVIAVSVFQLITWTLPRIMRLNPLLLSKKRY